MTEEIDRRELERALKYYMTPGRAAMVLAAIDLREQGDDRPLCARMDAVRHDVLARGRAWRRARREAWRAREAQRRLDEQRRREEAAGPAPYGWEVVVRHVGGTHAAVMWGGTTATLRKREVGLGLPFAEAEDQMVAHNRRQDASWQSFLKAGELR